jgi:hypothetical protein
MDEVLRGVQNTVSASSLVLSSTVADDNKHTQNWYHRPTKNPSPVTVSIHEDTLSGLVFFQHLLIHLKVLHEEKEHIISVSYTILANASEYPRLSVTGCYNPLKSMFFVAHSKQNQ